MTVKKSIWTVVVVAGFFLRPVLLRADEEGTKHYRLEYWNFGVEGKATVKGTESDLSDTSKVVSGSNHSIIADGEYWFDGWALMMDLSFAKQAATRQLSSSESVDWTYDTSMFTFGGYLPVWEKESNDNERTFKIDALLAVRSYFNTYKLTFHPFNEADPKDQSNWVNWVDPMLGLRIRGDVTEKLGLELYGDVGGFGVGSASELSILTRAAVAWKFTPTFSVIGGYRLFDLNSADQSGTRKTKLDAQMRGFTIGVEGKF